MKQCDHENFRATVNVNRLTKSDSDPTVIGCQIMPAIPGFAVRAN